MKIAILSRTTNSYSLRRLKERGEARGHQMSFINISHCFMNISATDPAVHYGEYESFQDIDAIIPRIDAANTFYGGAVLRQFETMKVYSLNTALALSCARDKLRSIQILARKNLPLPITGFADSPQDIEKLIDMVGGAPLLVKLLEGTEGKGTIFAETKQAAISVLNAFKKLKSNMLVQEYIEEASGTDIRCVVLGKEVIAAVRRRQEGDSLKHLRYTAVAPIALTQQERKLAVKAAAALKLNFASVDLIRSQRGPLIVDVNPSPPLEALEKTTGKDIAGLMIAFIEEQFKL
jgi:ribosomal protein S6--L-glutamate ligase